MLKLVNQRTLAMYPKINNLLKNTIYPKELLENIISGAKFAHAHMFN